MGDPGPFSRRAVVLMATLGAVSLLAAIVTAVAGGDSLPSSWSSDSFSRSAIGHRAFVEMLRKLDIPVFVSRWKSAERSVHGLLLVAEPRLESPADAARLRTLLGQARLALLVLPKRWGKPSQDRPGWLAASSLYPAATAAAPLDVIGVEATVVRVGGVGPTRLTLGPRPFGHDPTLAHAQLVRAPRLEPVLGAADGVLLGRVVRSALSGGGRLYLLSDPDLLATHGLTAADNALLIVDVIRRLLPPDGVVVVDETVHGYVQPPSLARELVSYPLILATVQLALFGIATVWAGLGRFGAPRPEASSGAGRSTLVENTAELLRFGGHWRFTLTRYSHVLLSDVGRRLHAPSDLTGTALVPWLRRLGALRHASRDIDATLAKLAAAQSPAVAVRIAGELAEWRKEVLGGYGAGRRARQERS